jgi:Holliday junction resolvase RusA-like endonuclease
VGSVPPVGFTVTLPLPPSTNNLFWNARRGRGRVATSKYRLWQALAIKSIWAQVPALNRIGGPVALSLCVPTKMRGDIDNRLKPTIDALVAAGRIDDDKHVQSINITRGGADAGTILVHAKAVRNR